MWDQGRIIGPHYEPEGRDGFIIFFVASDIILHFLLMQVSIRTEWEMPT